MARVLFINGGSEGHINPTIGVVQELISRGEEIVYITTESFRERIEKTGAIVRTFDELKFIKAFLSGGRNYLLERINGLLHTAEIVIPSILEQINGEHFDYIIHDSMFGCGNILAQILQLPAISSCTTFAQTKESFDKMLEEESIKIPSEILHQIEAEFKNLKLKIKNNYGVEINSQYEVFCNPAPLTIVYTTKEFQPNGNSFDRSFSFVGPSVTSRVQNTDFDLAAIKSKNLIYISFGTVFNRAIDFYNLCFEAFGNSEHFILLSIGYHTNVSDLGEIPENFIVKQYVPQIEVLKNTKLFISHGGMNSTSESLYYGVPLIVIPQGADQPLIAKQIDNIGAGIHLEMQNLTPIQLRNAADQVLNNASYHKEVTTISESFKKAGGYRQAVTEILQFYSHYTSKN
ncbi:macrolide family glycosyltransferase [Gottfriedia sp. NPDC056225]|uniref:macrolide family glycosyltransferase n=1 Tax=Gottfriedia sp. NPDC056225 TaxID=3345751 RepID=UPI0035D574CC